MLKAVHVVLAKNLMRAHTVVQEDGGKGAEFFGKTGKLGIQVIQTTFGARASATAWRTRARIRGATTGLASARATMFTHRRISIMGECISKKGGVARMMDGLVLHLVQSQLMSVIDVSDELLVSLLVA